MMDDLLHEFVTETNESLKVVDVELVRFEREPNNAKILDNIFRLVHKIKGTCGFLGLPRLQLVDAEREPNPLHLDPRLARVSNGIHRLDDHLLMVVGVNRLVEIETAAAAA